MKISRFEDLTVYQDAFRLQQAIFDATRELPKDERYSLTDQIRRSSRSVGANIAEAWKKRLYPAHFVSKLSDADAELAETRHWLHTATSCQYIDKALYEALTADAASVGARLPPSAFRPPPSVTASPRRRGRRRRARRRR